MAPSPGLAETRSSRTIQAPPAAIVPLRTIRRLRVPARMAPTLLFAAILLLPSLAGAAIWPERLGDFERASARRFAVADRSIWLEYGFEDAEQVRYEKDGKGWTATAIRLHDSTGAMAAFQWQRPAGAIPSQPNPSAPVPLPAQSGAQPAATQPDATPAATQPSGAQPSGTQPAGTRPGPKPYRPELLAVETPGAFMLAHGNYLLTFSGRKPEQAELEELYQVLPRLEQSSLPILREYLPSQNRIPGSERYVLGPVALERFQPGIAVSTAAFHMGAEAQIGRFRAAHGEITLGVFSYPTPSMARERAEAFQKVQGAVVKRTGPLIAVILSPPDLDDAERLLAQIRYQASVSWSEYVPSRKDNIGTLIVNIFILIGFLLVFGTVAGVAFGGIRAFRRNRSATDPDALTTLHLGGR